MKYLNIFVLTMCISTGVMFVKETDSKKKNIDSRVQVRPKSKKVMISIAPKPTVDMYVSIHNQKTLKLDRIIITPNTSSISVEIFDPNTHNSTNEKLDRVSFSVNPCILVDYLTQPKEVRKHYNFHDELDRRGQPANGEERLMQALATSVEYSYDNLPTMITLPNPMQILKDLLGCNC